MGIDIVLQKKKVDSCLLAFINTLKVASFKIRGEAEMESSCGFMDILKSYELIVADSPGHVSNYY